MMMMMMMNYLTSENLLASYRVTGGSSVLMMCEGNLVESIGAETLKEYPIGKLVLDNTAVRVKDKEAVVIYGKFMD